MNGIFTNDYTIETDVNWSVTEVAFVIGNDLPLTIDEGGALTYGDDFVLKVVEDTEIIVKPSAGEFQIIMAVGCFSHPAMMIRKKETAMEMVILPPHQVMTGYVSDFRIHHLPMPMGIISYTRQILSKFSPAKP